jgi:hypothetical protein
MAKTVYYPFGVIGTLYTVNSQVQKTSAMFGIVDEKKKWVAWYLLVETLDSKKQGPIDVAVLDDQGYEYDYFGAALGEAPLPQSFPFQQDLSKLAPKLGSPSSPATFDVWQNRDENPDRLGFRIQMHVRNGGIIFDFQYWLLNEKKRPYPQTKTPGRVCALGVEPFTKFTSLPSKVPSPDHKVVLMK